MQIVVVVGIVIYFFFSRYLKYRERTDDNKTEIEKEKEKTKQIKVIFEILTKRNPDEKLISIFDFWQVKDRTKPGELQQNKIKKEAALEDNMTLGKETPVCKPEKGRQIKFPQKNKE